MSAAGKVLTGFSLPYVALYAASAGTVTYSSGQKLARGVSVSIDPTTSNDNAFYADNGVAEQSAGALTGGTATLTVDGLFITAEDLIMGLPNPENITVGGASVSVWAYGDSATPPLVGVAFIARYQSDGVESFVPILLTKGRFQIPSFSAQTQGEDIDWQTQELTLNVMRDDTSAHDWKKIAADQTTEASAEAVIKKWFNIA